MSTSLFDSGAVDAGQFGFAFPEPLSEKYKPKRVADFMVDKPKRVMLSLLAKPHSSAWFLLGASGMGKTELVLAFANELPGQLHHIASKDCDLEAVRNIRLACSYVPHDIFEPSRVCKMHVVVVDEIDQASYPAQLAFLSLLDATAFPPRTIFVLTGNSTVGLEDRFLSRVRILEFSTYGMSEKITELLASIWRQEAGNAPPPNFARITKDSKGNIRDAINSVEVELMAI